MVRSSNSFRLLGAWIDVLAIAAWGVLFLNYWVTEKLYLLIHPNYMWLTVIAGFALIILAIWRALAIVRSRRDRGNNMTHINLLPPGWSSGLLLATAVLGLWVSPRPFTSQAAIHRGVKEGPTLTRVKPQAFRGAVNSQEKSIIDWVRTLTVYPEPDAYTGQSASVQGFVIHPSNLPDQYLLISRFILTCCAADAYPVSLPVKLTGSRSAYKPDTWLEVQGQMMTETLDGKRQLVLRASALKPIDEPKNPYDY